MQMSRPGIEDRASFTGSCFSGPDHPSIQDRSGLRNAGINSFVSIHKVRCRGTFSGFYSLFSICFHAKDFTISKLFDFHLTGLIFVFCTIILSLSGETNVTGRLDVLK